MPSPRSRRSPRRRSLLLYLALLGVIGLIALIVFLVREPPARKGDTVIRPEESTSTSPANPVPERRDKPSARRPLPSPPQLPSILSPSDDKRAWYQRMMDTRQTLLTKLDYAPGAVGLAGKVDLIPPHFVPPMQRPLQPHHAGLQGTPDDRPGDVQITQQQDLINLAPGERATASFEATLPGGKHPAVTMGRSVLVRVPPIVGTDSQPAPLEPTPITFHDDGVAPDAQAGDGSYSAFVPPAAEDVSGFGGELVVYVEVRAAGENGTLEYHFGQAGSVPARFTRVARDVLEDGSLAIYLGIEVFHGGHYEIRGRLYDANNQPVAFMDFVDDLTTDAHEVKLFAYGKLLRDQNAMPPFTLRDIEGWHYLLGQYPDREGMAMWAEGHRTAEFPIEKLTIETWDSPEKRALIEQFDKAFQDGLAGAPPDPGGR